MKQINFLFLFLSLSLMGIDLPTAVKEITPKKIEFNNGTTRSDGNLNWRYFNPGNHRCGAFATRHGAIGCSSTNFAIYPSLKHGYLAQISLLQGDSYIKLSIKEMIDKYSPKEENENNKDYLTFIEKKGQLKSSLILESLNKMEFFILAISMSLFEGMHKGDYYFTDK